MKRLNQCKLTDFINKVKKVSNKPTNTNDESEPEVAEPTNQASSNTAAAQQGQIQHIRENENETNSLEQEQILLVNPVRSDTNLVSEQSSCLDIGKYIGKSPDTGTKLALIKTPWMPGYCYEFPITKFSKINLSFQVKWFKDYNWLVYSDYLKGALCKFCVLFARGSSILGKNHQFGSLVVSAHSDWKNARRHYNSHQDLRYHKDSVLSCNEFLKTKTLDKTILNRLDNERILQIKKNRDRLKPIIETILLCGRQEISLRGHKDWGSLEDSEPAENDGNFRAILRMRIRCGDEQLKEHLKLTSAGLTYLSPTIQNEIIDTIGANIQHQLVTRLNSSKCFSLMADETTDIGGIEQLSVCARYVDSNAYLREDFLGFVPMVKTSGEELANNIMSFLRTKHVDVQYLRGQGYDGAGAMSGIHKGVQKRIREMGRKEALYVHCSSHYLNLALSDSCSVPAIRNTLGTINEIINFVTNSAIRLDTLKKAIQDKYSDISKSKSYKLIKYCDTRFIERHESVFRFVELFHCIINTLGIIEVDSASQPASKASIYLKAILDSSFIISMLISEEVLSSTLNVSKYLQDPQCDLVASVNYVDHCVKCLTSWRADSVSNFSRIFKKAEEIALEFDVQMAVPRITARQKHRENILASSPEEYFRLNTYIPFLDHVILNLKDRFEKHRNIISGLQHLVPKYMNDEYSFDEILSFYEADLNDSKNTVQIEIQMWTESWKLVEKGKKPSNALQSFIDCNEILFPNVKKLLKNLTTLPVSTCTPERTFSTLRRLKTYLRSTTAESRLNGLALMSIHRDLSLSTENILNLFAEKKARRLNIIL